MLKKRFVEIIFLAVFQGIPLVAPECVLGIDLVWAFRRVK